jgi:hypothetical protein
VERCPPATVASRRTQRWGGIASSSGSCRIVRESPQPTLIKHGKYTVAFENAFAAREDARPPRQGLLDRLYCLASEAALHQPLNFLALRS